MSTPRCQFCVNSPLRPSRSRGIKDRVMRALGRRPMRCHACEKRFYIHFDAPLVAQKK